MDGDKISIDRFNGKNYFLWEFAFRMYVVGKELCGIVDGTLAGLVTSSSVEYTQWHSQNATVVSWMLSTVDSHIAVDLRPYKTASAMWKYLKEVYFQDNEAHHFQLENEIADSHQGERSVQEYYSEFTALWQEYNTLIYAGQSDESVKVIQRIHETSQKHQFLMKLRREFEYVKSSLLNRSPVPTLSVCLNDVLREEHRLRTQQTMDTHSRSGPSEVAFAAISKPPGKDMSKIQCFSCHEYGHYASLCKKKNFATTANLVVMSFLNVLDDLRIVQLQRDELITLIL
ncbi:UBN2_3 domain-containing protein [Cephalotus follicularis]|uniref:UBN2_3 domain-containing protein n=1 Tax=Cephalotus follicularis TaxID=3775 RepID=A0A1Q3CRA9_CEPFO|nr:UBN2_3 domain-containing protein [Cephalotus follicularis]